MLRRLALDLSHQRVGRKKVVRLHENRRAEFSSEEDLVRYVSWSLLEDARKFNLQQDETAVLVSLSDRLVGAYPSGAQQ